MNFDYIITMIGIPVAMSIFVIFKNNSKKTWGNMLLTKGLYYYALAVFMVLNIFFDIVSLESLVCGYTASITIMEGAYAIKQGLETIKEGYEDDKRIRGKK